MLFCYVCSPTNSHNITPHHHHQLRCLRDVLLPAIPTCMISEYWCIVEMIYWFFYSFDIGRLRRLFGWNHTLQIQGFGLSSQLSASSGQGTLIYCIYLCIKLLDFVHSCHQKSKGVVFSFTTALLCWPLPTVLNISFVITKVLTFFFWVTQVCEMHCESNTVV